MHTIHIRSLVLVIFLSFMTASCNGFFDKDNTPTPTPLATYTPEVKPIKLWTTRAGSGIGDEYLKISPAISGNSLYTASAQGIVTSINLNDGRRNWQLHTNLPLTTSPGIGDGKLAIGSRKGDIIVLDTVHGIQLWKGSVPGEILATPAIQQNTVIIKTIDGVISAHTINNGQTLWSFQQVEPGLILRGASAPLIRDRDVIAGFANGNLAKLTLDQGQLEWVQPIAVPEGAFAIQRMIDIDADPVLYERHLYAATYQGRITSLDWYSGKALWSRDISSYTGMVADQNTIYISDAKGFVWAFNATNGSLNWKQTKLQARIITAPAMMGNYVVVGDAEGYLHWLDRRDGHFAARDYVGAMYAAPIVENNVLYALNNSGTVTAYKLK